MGYQGPVVNFQEDKGISFEVPNDLEIWSQWLEREDNDCRKEFAIPWRRDQEKDLGWNWRVFVPKIMITICNLSIGSFTSVWILVKKFKNL